MIKNIIRILIQNSVLANILMLLILISGIIASTTMVKEIFPQFSLNVISVVIPYPGADPEEIEEGICLKLEEALNGVEGVDNLILTAKEGSGSAIIECTENADISKVKDDVETQVNAITTFPSDSEEAIITELKLRKEVLRIAIWGNLPERQLKKTAQGMEKEILDLPGISQVDLIGIRDDEISIEVSEQNLRKYNIDFNDINNAVKNNGINLPAGTIKNSSEDIRIRVQGRRYSAKDYQDIPVLAKKDGTIITLGQIATIKDSFDIDSKSFVMFNGKPAVFISVYKTEQEDAIQISEEITKFIKAKQASFPTSIHLTKCLDLSRLISGRLSILTNNGIIGLALVIIILWLFLDLRLSFWVAMGIPISVAGGLAIMGLAGNSLNMITMFGLIMVLGLIVDDAIVIGENIYSKRQQGMNSLDAAVEGTSEVALPVIAAVMTTIIAFLPLCFITGVMGKFIGQIPIPVIAALSVSLIEGLFILPVHLRHLPVPGEPTILKVPILSKLRLKVIQILEYVIENIYGPAIYHILHYRYIALSVGICVLLIIGGMIQGSIIKYVFMPQIDDDFIRAKIELPPGTPIRQTKLVGEKVLAGWDKVANDYYNKTGKNLTVAAISLIGTNSGWKSNKQSNLLEVMIELLPSEERNIYYRNLLLQWQTNVGDIPGAIATNYKSFAHGPGGQPIEIELHGEDEKSMSETADKIVAKLNTIYGVYDAQTDYRAGEKEFIVSLKPEAYHLGLSLNDIAKHLRSGFYGEESLRIQRDRDDVKVKIRYPEDKRTSINYFKKLFISLPNGNKIPFLTVANIKTQEGQSVIYRKNRKRVLEVNAEVDDSIANATNILSDLNDNFLPQLTSRYGVTYSIEGQSKETNSTMSGLMIGIPLAMFGIYFIIASIFRSYIQPLIIMTTIPFGLIGAVIGHLIFNMPITIMSLFGMVALTGIVVNDSIVLIEGVNDRLASGLPLFEALREGGKRRFRAILLTTLTTFCGLMPLILEKSMQAQVLIPMAISIAFGVLFATGVTLILIPCFVGILNDIRRILYSAWYLKIPTKEDVEPRYKPPLK